MKEAGRAGGPALSGMCSPELRKALDNLNASLAQVASASAEVSAAAPP